MPDESESLGEGDPGKCNECGEPYQWVRPGKSQSMCDCWQRCPQHGAGAIQYHDRGDVPNVSGYFCLRCHDETARPAQEDDHE